MQSYEGGRGLAFHFDKDEHAMKERQEMVTPIFSSVLYLTGDSASQRQSESRLSRRANAACLAALPPLGRWVAFGASSTEAARSEHCSQRLE